MRREIIFWVITFLLVLVTSFSQGEINTRLSIIDTGYAYQKADSLYSNHNYFQALETFESALPVESGNRDLNTEFKIAYSAYKIGKYEYSARLFQKLSTVHQFLPEYSQYFYIKSLWHLNSGKAQKIARQFVDKFDRHTLADSMLIPIADQLYEEKSFQEARRYYRLAKKRRVKTGKNAYLSIQAGKALYHTGQTSQALNEFYQVLKKYPGNIPTFELTGWLKEHEPEFYQKHFFNIVDVYYNNRKYISLKKLLEDYIKSELDETKKEKARYNLIKIYYAEKRYKTALYGFKTLLSELSEINLEPSIRFYLARIYNRLGLKQKAIDAYLDYSARYPRRRIAPETVWKSAWIYEEMNKPEKAIELYRDIRRRWKRSRYAKEAHFREGFTLYRLGRYKEADQVFSDIRFRNWPDLHVNRAQFWSALCRDVVGDSITAKRLRLDLARNIWDDYYTMKSYLLQKSHIDRSWNMIREFRNTPNPLTYYAPGFAKLLGRLEKAFQVRELLGSKFGLIALNDLKLVANTREEWIALAEVYKKFGAYGKAYRIYDYINNKFYGNVSYLEKSFMLKERFPFYYDRSVEEYSHRYGLEKEFILAIIKQESAYRANALSRANACGLMQLIPMTAGDMARLAGISLQNTEQLFDPDLNIHLGSLYVKQLNRQFNGQKERILAAYNAGPHRVQRWQKIPGSKQIDVFIENIEFYETRNYVRIVMKNYWAYKLLSNNFHIEDEEMLLGYLE